MQHIASLLLDRHFVLCLPPQLLFVSDDDEDVVKRDGAHLLIVLFVRIKKEINNISQNGTTLGSWSSCPRGLKAMCSQDRPCVRHQ